MSRWIAGAVSLFVLAANFGCSASGSGHVKTADLAEGETFHPLEERVLENGWGEAIDGDRLVTNGQDGLKVTDLTDNRVLAFIPSKDVVDFDLSGDFVVWSDLRNEETPIGEIGSYDAANADIYLYNLSTGEVKQLTDDPSAQISPKIWNNYAVWMDNATDKTKAYPSHWQIVLYDIETGERKTITSGNGGHTDPDIDAGHVVWEDGRHVTDRGLRAGGNVPENNTDVYLYRIETGETIPIATEHYKEGRPKVSGSRVVWEGYDGNYAGDVFVHDTNTGKTFRLTDSEASQRDPVINGRFVAWMDERNGSSTHDVGPGPHNSDIFLADLEKGTETLITGEGPQIQPLISDRWIVFGKASDTEAFLTAVRYR